jgi:hypothetical protein
MAKNMGIHDCSIHLNNFQEVMANALQLVFIKCNSLVQIISKPNNHVPIGSIRVNKQSF